jgi:hypothetical protein
MGVGTLAPLGYAKETTPGTPVAAATWIPMLDGSGDPDIDLQFPEYITNTRQVNRNALLGEQKTRGMVRFTMFPDQGVDLIAGAIAAPTGTTPYWLGTYLPGALPSYTLELQKGGIQAFRLTGAMVDKLKVTAEAGKQIEIQEDFFALDYVKLGSPGTPAYTTTDPFNFSNTTVQLYAYGGGATTDTDITKVEFTLDNHLLEQWTLQAATAAPKRTDSGKVTCSGTLTKYFADTTLFDAYRAKTLQALTLAWTGGGHTFTFTLPKIAIKTHKIPVRLGQFIVQEFDFTCLNDSVVGGIIQLVNS